MVSIFLGVLIRNLSTVLTIILKPVPLRRTVRATKVVRTFSRRKFYRSFILTVFTFASRQASSSPDQEVHDREYEAWISRR